MSGVPSHRVRLSDMLFSTSSKGYGGEVSVLTGIGTDGKVVGVTVLEHNETPGMGSKVTGTSFPRTVFGQKKALRSART